MLSLQARRGRRGLDRVKPIQLLRIFAPLRVVAHQLVEPRIRGSGKKIRIQRKNHIRRGKIVLDCRRILHPGLGQRRVILNQRRLRIRSLKRLPLPPKRRRRHRRAHDVDASSILAFRQLFFERLRKLRPLAILAAIGHMLCTVWIVEIQQRSLRKRIG